jgi:hypothetical protein
MDLEQDKDAEKIALASFRLAYVARSHPASSDRESPAGAPPARTQRTQYNSVTA